MTSPLEITLAGRIAHITYYNRRTTSPSPGCAPMKTTAPSPSRAPCLRRQWGKRSRSGALGEPCPLWAAAARLTAYRLRLPATVDGIRSYLASGFIKGVGPKLIDRIIDHFKADTLAVIDANPDRLTEVAGIGKKTARRIADAWQSHHAAGQLVRFLEETGVDTAYAARLLREYGNDVIDILCNDPYRVAEDIPRIGFRIADAIVRHADTPVDETDRAKACMIHLFEQAVDQGHAYIAQDQLFDQCREAFDVQPKTGAPHGHLVQTGELVVEDEAGWGIRPWSFPRLLHRAETVIARRIAAMQAIPLADTPPDSRLITAEVLNKLSITLSAQQEEILSQMLAHKVSVITGGPGTGKTTLIRSITAVMEGLGAG
jgi:exodeoxyribonuclease V alpha subunit